MAVKPTKPVRETHIAPGPGSNKKHRKNVVRLNGVRVALVYPNTYYVGMSNLGFQTVCRLINQVKDTVCERAFLPERKVPPECKVPLPNRRTSQIRTIESNSLLTDFDIVAFSLSYENDYINLIGILEAAGIPVWSRERGASHPLVVAGGVACMLNPEPVADFLDCILIGEAEGLLPRFFSVFSEHTGQMDKTALLKTMAQNVPGAYIPEFYQTEYNPDGTIRTFKPIADVPEKIRRVCLDDLSETNTHSAILTPDTVFSDTFLIETARGCPRGCRFCGAGYVYRPPRFRAIQSLSDCIGKLAAPAEKIGLVGAAVSDLVGISDLCNAIIPENPRISLSSLRADSVTPELAAVLRQSGTKTATIAPEAGSQRMRDVINKGLSEPDILNTADCLVSNGIPNLRLYFMIGLPTETMEDVDAIVGLCERIKSVFLQSSRPQKRIGQITVSLNAFVPKPWTPFQWAGMDELAVLKKKTKRIKRGLKSLPNVNFQSEPPRQAQIQAILARGGRNISELLYRAFKNQGNWPKTLKEVDFDMNTVSREREPDEIFPWDFIDHGINKVFLKNEYARARKGKPTRPCKTDSESCNACGVCGKSPLAGTP